MIWKTASRLASAEMEKPISFDHYVIEMLDGMAENLSLLLKRVEEIMAQFQDVKALITAVNNATNQIAEDVTAADERVAAIEKKLADLIAQGATPEQMQEALLGLTQVHDNLTAAGNALKGIAADPSNPIPEPA